MTARERHAAHDRAQEPSVEYAGRERALDGPWSFREAGSHDWLPATIPGTVHTDLLANGRIDDPFYRTNERTVQWIDKVDWEYRTVLDLDADVLRQERIELVFHGLDTYAEVCLNGRPILSATNMFRTWVADIKPSARAGRNELSILLRSPVRAGLRRLRAFGYNPPAVVDWSEIGGLGERKISMFTRKAPYHYGWDWGPRLVTSGIWRPIRLRAWSGARITSLRIATRHLSEDEAALTAVCDIDSNVAAPAILELHSPTDAAVGARAEVRLAAGAQQVSLDFTIRTPRLWWTNGIGEPFLYEFTAQLIGAQLRDRCDQRVGLRTLRVVQAPDAHGTSFQFELNGRPVFMKGANYIPNDSFLPRVSRSVYERVVRAAAESNMNMLRVWGGGVYEDDLFYDLCDRSGILVWQDFMFACVMYPGDDEFLDDVRQEAVDNVRRLRHHPCIALWVGNNEIDVAWQHDVPDGGWGWKESYSPAQRAQLWLAYRALFHQILPQVVSDHDPQRFYWPSSPLAAWDGGERTVHADLRAPRQSGDVHYWGVWWGRKPFASYRSEIGRFMSEYGFQAFPPLRSLKAFCTPQDYDILSEVLQAHQRSKIGNGTIRAYMAEDYRVPERFEHFIYVSQVLQAHGVRTAIEAHRARMPYCMGSLYWQINDCWPAASWSSIDYYGRWKALQYAARKAFAAVAVSFWPDGDALTVWVVNDRRCDTAANLTLRLIDFHGAVLAVSSRSVRMAANRSTPAFTGSMRDLLGEAPPHSVLLQARLGTGTEVLAENLYYFRPVKELALPRGSPEVRFDAHAQHCDLTLSSPVLLKDLYLDAADSDGLFSDNYFDLLPGEPKSVRFTPAGRFDARDLIRDLTFMHMALSTD